MTRTRTSWHLIAVAIALLGSFVAFARAQQTTRLKIPPPEFKRESELDVTGLRQWKPFDVQCEQCKGMTNLACEHCKQANFPICNECDLTKRAPCRLCGGTGKAPDPMLELQCPYCWGSSWYSCGLCNGFGTLKVDNNETKCGACKSKGLMKCIACAGTRRVDTVRFGKRSVGEGSAKELRELLERLKAALTAMQAYEPDPNPSKAAKAFAKALEPLERDLKVIKEMEKMLEESVKGVKSYGAGYTSYQENLLEQFFIFKDRTVFLLQFQIRAAEQSLERAEFNESKSK